MPLHIETGRYVGLEKDSQIKSFCFILSFFFTRKPVRSCLIIQRKRKHGTWGREHGTIRCIYVCIYDFYFDLLFIFIFISFLLLFSLCSCNPDQQDWKLSACIWNAHDGLILFLLQRCYIVPWGIGHNLAWHQDKHSFVHSFTVRRKSVWLDLMPHISHTKWGLRHCLRNVIHWSNRVTCSWDKGSEEEKLCCCL